MVGEHAAAWTGTSAGHPGAATIRGGLEEEQAWGRAPGPRLDLSSWRCRGAPVGGVEQAAECVSWDPEGKATSGDKV